MIPPPHAECPRCREYIPLLKARSMFAPEDRPYLFIATHNRLQRNHTLAEDETTVRAEEFPVRCEGSMEEVES